MFSMFVGIPFIFGMPIGYTLPQAPIPAIVVEQQDVPPETNHSLQIRATRQQGNCLNRMYITGAGFHDTSCAQVPLSTTVYVFNEHVMTLRPSAQAATYTFETDANGYGSIDLEPGNYSVFISDPNQGFTPECTKYDMRGFACSVVISENQQSYHEFSITRTEQAGLF